MKAKILIPAAIIVAAIIMLTIGIATQVADIPMKTFARDLRALSQSGGVWLPYYAGLLSTVTIMVWAAGSAMSFLAATIVRARRIWLLVLGGLLLTMAVDDAFMLHEGYGPSVGIPELAFYAVYATAAAWLLAYSLLRFRDESVLALIAGGAALAASIAIDLSFEGQYFLEDGAKLAGALVMLTIGPVAIGSAIREWGAIMPRERTRR